jgi:hypothetical protein
MRDRDMSAVKASPVFTVTTPSVTVMLSENRIGEVPFTVTNVGNRKLRARAKITPGPGAPGDWFSVAGDSERDFEIGAARQFVVRVDPPLGAPAGTYAFRLDAVGIEHPDDDYSEGPSCQVTIPPSSPQQPKLTTPRGYITTLVGALTGGIVLDVIVVILALTHETDTSCDGGFVECLFTVLIREIFFWVFLVFLGFVLMLVGASVGSAIALRIRRFRGHKLTGTFLAVLMLPWTLLMALTVFHLLENHPIVLATISPIVLLAVPAVLARGGVLLIRTHHI